MVKYSRGEIGRARHPRPHPTSGARDEEAEGAQEERADDAGLQLVLAHLGDDGWIGLSGRSTRVGSASGRGCAGEEKCTEGTEGTEPRLGIGRSITRFRVGERETHLAGASPAAGARTSLRLAAIGGRIARAASLARAPRRRVACQLQSPKISRAHRSSSAERDALAARARAPAIAGDEVPTRRSATTRAARAPPWRPRAPPGTALDAAYASATGRTLVTRAAMVRGVKMLVAEPARAMVRRVRWGLRVLADARKELRHSLERTDRRGRAPAPSICRPTR